MRTEYPTHEGHETNVPLIYSHLPSILFFKQLWGNANLFKKDKGWYWINYIYATMMHFNHITCMTDILFAHWYSLVSLKAMCMKLVPIKKAIGLPYKWHILHVCVCQCQSLYCGYLIFFLYKENHSFSIKVQSQNSKLYWQINLKQQSVTS